MCHGRSQPTDGADSAQALADAIALLETYGYSVSRNGERHLQQANLAGGVISLREIAEAPASERPTLLHQRLAEKEAEYGRISGAILPRCISCSELALPTSVYCADHDSGEPPLRHPGLVDQEPYSGGFADNE